jgi:hypothetical protein
MEQAMMTVRLSDQHLRAWLDCEFCGATYEFPYQAQTFWKGTDHETTMPTLDNAIKWHYWLNEHGSHGFAPCPKRHLWQDTDCQFVDQDTGAVRQQARLRFDHQRGIFDVA